MRFCYLSGLSPRFQGLSRSSWAGCLRITHPFASISSQQAGHPSIDLHVLGTPPAFILSQDQTLHLIDSYSTGSFTSFLHKSWRSFVFYIPVQFSKSFPLSFRTARWLSHLVSPLSTCFFTNFSGWLLPSHSVHSKISSLFSRLISCQSSPTARLYYLMPYLLASVIFLFFALLSENFM